jgi:energy-coupling factor transporter transmembrane protein EcfT
MSAHGPLAGESALSRPRVGSLAHVAIFLWALFTVTLVGGEARYGILLACLVVLGAVYPFALRRLARPRWFVLFAILLGVNLLFGDGEPDLVLWSLPLSSENLAAGALMILRALVILLAADGLASSIDISEVAGLFEGFGLSGLGFSLGVAVNLLPNIREGALNAWRSLRMRGGLRSQWWRGLQLFSLTVLTNALRRSEDIVLAAEARAFSPERSRSFSLRVGRLDWLVVAIGAAALLLLVLLPG